MRPPRGLFGLAVGLVLVLVGACGLSASAFAETATFKYTGGEQTFAVPAGVTHIHVESVGGAGGTAPAGGTLGGRGAVVSGTVTVTPGHTLYVEVGGAGAGTTGGFNGGGGQTNGDFGGGGGGASDVRTIARIEPKTLESRLIVAAGGGGGGSENVCQGGAGGDAEKDGASGSSCGWPAPTGGGAGTAKSGGPTGTNCCFPEYNGEPGTLGVGGTGRTGGGGGGGLYGGGSGGFGGGSGFITEVAGSGGGGGGSSLVPVGGSAALDENSAPPSVTLTYPVLPVVVTGSASEVTAASATVGGTVNPKGSEVSKCLFEYGTTELYEMSESCSALPGSGASPVAVSASLTKLAAETTYHFRIAATGEAGTSGGADQTFTTLASSDTGSTKEAARPAEAEDHGLSVKATEGTGSVTVGPYGQDIGGPPLARSKGAYFQVYHSEGSSFKTIEYKDCELDGAKAIWWDNPSTGWEPISAPTAVYSEATHCITVTATESTTPSIAQLSDPRHVGGPSATQEFGKCELLKHGHFEDGGCTKEKYSEKGGIKSYKGKYEWYGEQVQCFPLKHGHYADAGCSQKSESKKGKGTGGFEQATSAFTTSGGHAKLEVSGLASVECQASTSTGTLTDSKLGFEAITFTGCQQPNATKCTSVGASPGTIATNRLETYTFEEGGNYKVLAGNPIAVFSCGSVVYTLAGATAGSLTVPLNTMTTAGEAKFGGGQQELELLDPLGLPHPATLSTTTSILEAQAIELRATG